MLFFAMKFILWLNVIVADSSSRHAVRGWKLRTELLATMAHFMAKRIITVDLVAKFEVQQKVTFYDNFKFMTKSMFVAVICCTKPPNSKLPKKLD